MRVLLLEAEGRFRKTHEFISKDGQHAFRAGRNTDNGTWDHRHYTKSRNGWKHVVDHGYDGHETKDDAAAAAKADRDSINNPSRARKEYIRGLDQRDEAVDPEDRKVRLKKLIDYAHKQRMNGRLARETRGEWDQANNNQSYHATSMGGKMMDAQYTAWKKGSKARAIVQKHTGIDHRIDAYDWSGGGRGPRKRPSLKNKIAAYKELLTRNAEKRGIRIPKRKLSSIANKWIAKRRSGLSQAPTQ